MVLIRLKGCPGWSVPLFFAFNKVKLSHNDASMPGKRSGSLVECLTRDRGVAGSSVTSVIVLCP